MLLFMPRQSIRKRAIRSCVLGLIIFFLLLPSLCQVVSAASLTPIVNPKQIYSYARLSSDLHALANRYPELLKLDSAGTSEYGRQLWMIDVGHGPAVIMLNGAHHAREWVTSVTLMMLIEDMASRYRQNGTASNGLNVRDLLDRVTFRIVPMVNPDGVTLQQFGVTAFPAADQAALVRMNDGSRNFKRWKANARGIDLNRQYPAGWDNIASPGSKPFYMNYKGTKPLQAKEVQAMYNLTLKTKPEISLAYHSSGEILFWHFKTKAENVARDYQIASAFASMTGYDMVAPKKNPSGGGFTDWFIQEFARPGLTLELGRNAGATHVPLSEWDRIWKQHKSTDWMLAEEAYRLWMKRQTAAKLTADIRLTAAESGYQYPELRSKKLAMVYPGRYKTLRQKGDWLEISTNEGPRWIASRAVLSGPVELPQSMQVEVNETTVHYDTPLSDRPSSRTLTVQTAAVREHWPGWLFVSTKQGMIWIREADLAEPATDAQDAGTSSDVAPEAETVIETANP